MGRYIRWHYTLNTMSHSQSLQKCSTRAYLQLYPRWQVTFHCSSINDLSGNSKQVAFFVPSNPFNVVEGLSVQDPVARRCNIVALPVPSLSCVLTTFPISHAEQLTWLSDKQNFESCGACFSLQWDHLSYCVHPSTVQDVKTTWKPFVGACTAWDILRCVQQQKLIFGKIWVSPPIVTPT